MHGQLISNVNAEGVLVGADMLLCILSFAFCYLVLRFLSLSLSAVQVGPVAYTGEAAVTQCNWMQQSVHPKLSDRYVPCVLYAKPVERWFCTMSSCSLPFVVCSFLN